MAHCNDVIIFPGPVKSLAEQYAARGVLEPANCLWMHLFAENKHTEAEEVGNKIQFLYCVHSLRWDFVLNRIMSIVQ